MAARAAKAVLSEDVFESAAPPPASSLPDDASVDVTLIAKELSAIADYITKLRQEIGSLKANELCAERIPSAGKELDLVVEATASATNTIMAAAEDIMGYCGDDAGFRELANEKVLAIFEACSFQDITGQRIAKVVETLEQIENRVTRFVSAVKARDIETDLEPDEALRKARRDMLLLNGPQAPTEAIAQNDVDAMFGEDASDGPASQNDIDSLFD